LMPFLCLAKLESRWPWHIEVTGRPAPMQPWRPTRLTAQQQRPTAATPFSQVEAGRLSQAALRPTLLSPEGTTRFALHSISMAVIVAHSVRSRRHSECHLILKYQLHFCETIA